MSDKFSLPKTEQFNGTAYRNIYTIKESQNLFDDLVSDPSSLPILQSWDNESSGIDHSQTPSDRPFQYANVATIDVLIAPGKWHESRFSDGTFGVWYGALEEQTSIQEALFRSYNFSKEDFEKENFPIVVERKMFSASIRTNACIDLRGMKQDTKLTSENYAFCQDLGRKAVKESTGMYLTPSARKEGGTCTPVFDSKCIQKDDALYFLKFIFLSSNDVRVTRDVDELLTIPDSWKGKN